MDPTAALLALEAMPGLVRNPILLRTWWLRWMSAGNCTSLPE
jgi:hypothetical protein